VDGSGDGYYGIRRSMSFTRTLSFDRLRLRSGRHGGPAYRHSAAHVSKSGAKPYIPIVYCEDEKHQWMKHIVVIPHNAVRRQMLDFFNILRSVRQRKAKTGRDEDEKLCDWWSVVEPFIKDVFRVEDGVFFPVLRKAIEMEPPAEAVDAERFNRFVVEAESARRQVDVSVESMSNVMENIFVSPLVKNFSLLVDAYSQLSKHVLAYFELVENNLPDFVQSVIPVDRKREIHQVMVDTLLSGRWPKINVVMLTLWMEHPKQITHWRRNSLRGPARLMVSSWENSYFKTHGQIVRDFHEAALNNRGMTVRASDILHSSTGSRAAASIQPQSVAA